MTEAGQAATQDQIGPLHAQFVAAYSKKKGTKKRGAKSDVSSE